MVFTDPPYNVNYGATMKDKLRKSTRKIANDNLGDGFEQFLRDVCVNILAVTKGGHHRNSKYSTGVQSAFLDAIHGEEGQ